MNTSRRHFLRSGAALAAVAGYPLAPRLPGSFAASLAGLASLSAQAADLASPYRALVCLYMNGGNDAHNWVVPIDPAGYADYAAVRQNLAWPLDQLAPITTATSQGSGRSFGLPRDLDPLRRWYDAGHAAIVANVGTLARPTTKADFQAGTALPPKLFSHNDQASYWQALAPEGAASGWAGRMGDILMAANDQPVFTAVSATGNAVLLAGRSLVPYQVSENGPVTIGALSAGSLFGSPVAPATLRRIIGAPGTNAFETEYAKVVQRSLDTTGPLLAALSQVGLPALPTTPVALSNGDTLTLAGLGLARQLRVVAQMIGAASTLGLRRQVFYVDIGGFDSHSNQKANQPALMARVAGAIDWFLGAVSGLGLLDNVMLFTASDFGRALASNGDGCDHGWGSHHFVAGGAVKGHDIYGSFPLTALGTGTDVGSGRLLPTTSVTQYAATLGAWMGLTPAELGDVLPNLPQFSPSTLGFA